MCNTPLKVFLSTLSLRRATSVNVQSPTAEKNFYPRSPCGERPPSRSPCSRNRKFLSTLSLRRATTLIQKLAHLCLISIHALLAESDIIKISFPFRPTIFLSTLSLRRATQIALQARRLLPNFYPRSPCGERQIMFNDRTFKTRISIHALLAESDRKVPLLGIK